MSTAVPISHKSLCGVFFPPRKHFTKEIQIHWHLVNFQSLNKIKLLVELYKLSVAQKPIFNHYKDFMMAQRSHSGISIQRDTDAAQKGDILKTQLFFCTCWKYSSVVECLPHMHEHRGSILATQETPHCQK